MPKKRKAAARPSGPITGTLAATEAPDVAAVVGTQRPVIAGRLSQESYDRIKAWAAASGRSMSEELAWRAEQSVAWEKAHGTVQALLAEALRSTQNIAAQIVWEECNEASKPPVIDAALALGRLTGLTGKDEVIWLRACLEACSLLEAPPD